MEVVVCHVGEKRIGVYHAGAPDQGAARIDVDRGLATFHVGVTDSKVRRAHVPEPKNFRPFWCAVIAENRIRNGGGVAVVAVDPAAVLGGLVSRHRVTCEDIIGERVVGDSASVRGCVLTDCVVGNVKVPVLLIVLTIGAVNVLLDNVWVSVVPTTSPVGTAFAAVTALVPFPCKNVPDVNVVAPVPPSK